MRFVLASSAQEHCGKKLHRQEIAERNRQKKKFKGTGLRRRRQIICRQIPSEHIILFRIEDTQEIHCIR
jgi:hypothetical protein